MVEKNVKTKKENTRRNGHSVKNAQAAAKPDYSLRLVVAIVEHGRAKDIVETLLSKFGIKFHIVCQGEGTADSALLQLLNLDKSSKDVIINVVETAKAPDVLQGIRDSYEGSGIAFTIKLTSIGGMKALQLITGDLKTLNINIDNNADRKE